MKLTSAKVKKFILSQLVNSYDLAKENKTKVNIIVEDADVDTFNATIEFIPKKDADFNSFVVYVEYVEKGAIYCHMDETHIYKGNEEMFAAIASDISNIIIHIDDLE